MQNSKFLFLIGAAKCGTTSLADWLDRHSNIVLAKHKEPGYFRSGERRFVFNGFYPKKYEPAPAELYPTSHDSYLRLFDHAVGDEWRLDASTDYLVDPGCAERIKAYTDDKQVKLLCVLRDPIERAFSEYRHTTRDKLEPLSFRQSIERESERMAQGFQPLFFHIERGRYFEQISRYRALFGDQLLLIGFDELSAPQTLMEKIAAHLEIEAEDLGPMKTLNASRKKPERGLAAWIRSSKSAAKQLLRGAAQPWRHLRRGDRSLREEDGDRVFELLRDEIEKCIADPGIPTDGWTTTQRRLSARALKGAA